MYLYFNTNLKGDVACGNISPVRLLFCIIYICIDRSWVTPRKIMRLTWTVMRYTKKIVPKRCPLSSNTSESTHITFSSCFLQTMADGNTPLFTKKINFHITFGFHQTSLITCSAMLGASHACQRASNSGGGLSNTRIHSGRAMATAQAAPRAPTGAQGAGEPFWRSQHLCWRSLCTPTLQPALPHGEPSPAEPCPQRRQQRSHRTALQPGIKTRLRLPASNAPRRPFRSPKLHVPTRTADSAEGNAGAVRAGKRSPRRPSHRFPPPPPPIPPLSNGGLNFPRTLCATYALAS